MRKRATLVLICVLLTAGCGRSEPSAREGAIRGGAQVHIAPPRAIPLLGEEIPAPRTLRRSLDEALERNQGIEFRRVFRAGNTAFFLATVMQADGESTVAGIAERQGNAWTVAQILGGQYSSADPFGSSRRDGSAVVPLQSARVSALTGIMERGVTKVASLASTGGTLDSSEIQIDGAMLLVVQEWGTLVTYEGRTVSSISWLAPPGTQSAGELPEEAEKAALDFLKAASGDAWREAQNLTVNPSESRGAISFLNRFMRGFEIQGSPTSDVGGDSVAYPLGESGYELELRVEEVDAGWAIGEFSITKGDL
jgi:hypothetical protein